MISVSVVLITFNRYTSLYSSINSVMNQSFPVLEVLVVDGSNSVENKSVVSMFDNSIVKYVPVEPSAVGLYSQFGMQHSRNVGCRLAKGDYIAMLDDDDYWLPDKLEKQVCFLEAQPNPGSVGVVICFNRNVERNGSYFETPKLFPSYKDLLRSFNLSPTSTFLIKRSVLESVGYWDESLRGMHEYDVALKISKLGFRIITVPEVLVERWRFSNTKRGYYFVKIAEVLDFWKHYGKDLFPFLGVSGFVSNVVKTLGLFFIFLLGFLFKDRVWKIIYPLKTFYEQGTKIGVNV